MKTLFIRSFLALASILVLSSCGKNKNSSGTCSDGILNQNETSVDCGGKCSECPTCSDRIQNQGETSVDCGGPCGNCPLFYPAFGSLGGNILRNDTITLKGNPAVSTNNDMNAYSIVVDNPANSTVKIVLTKLSGTATPWWLSGASATGWKWTQYKNDRQEFSVNFPVRADMGIYFEESGSVLVEAFINNAATAAWTKTLSWTK